MSPFFKDLYSVELRRADTGLGLTLTVSFTVLCESYFKWAAFPSCSQGCDFAVFDREYHRICLFLSKM